MWSLCGTFQDFVVRRRCAHRRQGLFQRPMSISERKHTIGVDVGGIRVGGGAPIVVQSMTNTDTADIESTVRQVAQFWHAGSELVRITVARDERAAAVPHIRARLA